VIGGPCGGSNVTFSVLSTVTNSGPCPWVITRTWRAIDSCTNLFYASQTVTVVDTLPPRITQCPANQTLVADTNCLATIPDLRGQLLATDACGPITIRQNPIFTQVGPGTYPVVFTVCDPCTNCVVCSNFVTVLCVTNLGSLCGVKFDDVNRNGQQDPGEPGLPNWTINASGPIGVSTVTDSQGHYCFTNLVPAPTRSVKWRRPAGPGFPGVRLLLRHD